MSEMIQRNEDFDDQFDALGRTWSITNSVEPRQNSNSSDQGI
jgi:hypothetical protein